MCFLCDDFFICIFNDFHKRQVGGMFVQRLQAKAETRRDVASHVVPLRRYKVVGDGRTRIDDEDWPTAPSLIPAGHGGCKTIRAQRLGRGVAVSDRKRHELIKILLLPLRQFVDCLAHRRTEFSRHGHKTSTDCLPR